MSQNNRLFGTDGVRGIANSELSCETAFKLGSALGTKLGEHRSRPLVVIGKDTRISSDMLEAGLIAGFTSCGCDVAQLGIIPTPAVSFLTRSFNADAGIVISASHNPFESNGIKVFDGLGVKLAPSEEGELESRIYEGSVIRRSRGDIGRVIPRPDAVEIYIDSICENFDKRFTGLKVALDCANGATSAIAARLFEILGCETKIINAEPTGTNINKACGSTDMRALKALVAGGGFDCGFAFDGDGDRCLAVDENGNVVDGDHEIAILACDLLSNGRLPESKVVTTVMTNYGFHEMAKANGLYVHVSDVGDRNVLEDMLTSGAVLGGEQSGHIIYLERERTGDGLVTAMLMIDAMLRSKKKLSALAAVMDTVPQLMQNVPVPNEKKAHIMRCEPVSKAIAAASESLDGQGRVLVRPSGTEPLIRVMAEGRDDHTVRSAVESIVKAIRSVI